MNAVNKIKATFKNSSTDPKESEKRIFEAYRIVFEKAAEIIRTRKRNLKSIK